jgi:peptidoglycan hydrolase-like protein with peptidoglycan-binding domain
MRFRPSVLLLTVASVAIAVVSAQTAPVHKEPAAKKTATTRKAPTASKTVTSKKGPAASSKKRVVAKRAPSQPRQSAPTPDRYKQIQEALATKGYLKSEPNGVWDANSVDAMKRFQADQKLDASGKLTSASLIGLGLGPRTALMSSSAMSSSAAPASVP